MIKETNMRRNKLFLILLAIAILVCIVMISAMYYINSEKEPAKAVYVINSNYDFY